MRLVVVGALFCLGLTGLFASPTSLARASETVVFGFVTRSGQSVSVCLGDNGRYLVYRIGKGDQVEWQFPTEEDDSWSKFDYGFYLRGGGPDNDGVDIQQLTFQNRGWTYTVYQEWSAEDGVTTCGVRVEGEGKTTDLAGDPRSLVGSLAKLKDVGALKKHELFDGGVPES